MKAFAFRLQTSLNVSQRREQVAREALQACLAEKERLEEQLRLNQNKIDRLEEHIRTLLASQALSQEALMFREYLPVLHAASRELERKIETAEELVEKARLELVDRKKDTQTLERLRDKEWQEYMHELLLEEQKAIDEIAINTHYRKNNAEPLEGPAGGQGVPGHN